MHANRPPSPLSGALHLAVAAAIALATTAPATAATPTGFAVEGQLQTAAGGPAADGPYLTTLRLYASAGDQQAVWVSVVDKLTVSGGRFRHVLGSVVPLSPTLLNTGKAAWLGVQVGNEPELARAPLYASAFSQRSSTAGGVQCTGCVSMTALKADVDLNLGGGAVAAKTLSSNSVLAGSIVAELFSGGGAGVTGAVPPSASCPAGKVVVGVKEDGSLNCQEAVAEGDGLEVVTGNLWSTAYAEPSVSKTVPKPIQDNNPIGTVDEITVDDVGLLKKFSVSVHLTNSDLTGVEVILYDPTNAVFVLHKGKPGSKLQETWPITAQPVSGDLNAWLGKNPKGKWRLRIIDSKLLNGANDGELLSWSINMLSKSTNQVTSAGKFVAAGGFIFQRSAGPPFACGDKTVGSQYFDTAAARMYYCDGEWRELLVESLCGNGVVNSTENCDDSNVVDGDGCTHLCLKNVCGDGIVWPGKEQCDDGNQDDADACSNACVAKFKQVTFTTCGASGPQGPNQNQCNTAYGVGNDLNGKVTVNGGVQSWKVPYNGTFRIEAWGGQGGNDTWTWAGGKGARMAGTMNLQAGTTLRIIVGHAGSPTSKGNAANGGAGGGGGSFVWVDGAAQPLIAAGGGGGSCLKNNGAVACTGKPGVTTTHGSPSPPNSANNAGQNGSDSSCANGGHGWNTIKNNPVGTNTSSYNNGGGFGGGSGGGSNCGGNYGHAAGGGGGYSGGGGGTVSYYYAGGGGGSYNVGAKPNNSEGVNSGHGKVVIGP